MPFRDAFNNLKSSWDEIKKGNTQHPISHQQQYPGQQQPPVPQDSRPVAYQQQPSTVYWQSKFDPSIPVGAEWDQKQGNNNGWGNAELENYTSNPENSFHTSDGKLVVRAIANHSSPSPENKFTSARLVSRHTLSRQQGCLTAVLSLPCASGIWPAFWLLPKEPFTWPHEGEIDIAETWNGDRNNKSCLHWGFFTGEDAWKHRTIGTQINDMAQRPVRFDFAWEQQQPGQGRMVWYIDGRPVMKAPIPAGTRPISDFQILLNVAMGGNVCAGQVPANGSYDLVVHQMYMSEQLENGGWQRFEADWNNSPEGNTM